MLLTTTLIVATLFSGKAFHFPEKDEFSLLFSPKEYASLKQARLMLESKKQTTLDQADYLHLKAILYIDPNHWTIWVNDFKGTAQTPIAALTVSQVTAGHVQCTWHHKEREYLVELKIHHTFWRNRGDILSAMPDH